MKCVYTFGTGRHKRQADRTLLFQYIIMLETDCSEQFETLKSSNHSIFLNVGLGEEYNK